jgi:hypothetical protein
MADALKSRIVLTLVCFVWLEELAGSTSNEPDSYSLKITVRVSNYAQVLPETWGRAEKVATQIFERTGIDVRWLDCFLSPKGDYTLSDCKQPIGPTDLILRLVPVSVATRAHFGDALGVTAQPEQGTLASASVFYDRVEELGRGGYASKSVILGHAIAHELGHVLLGSHSHAPMGLMRAKWTRQDLQRATIGELLFTGPEAVSIRQNVLGRIQSKMRVVVPVVSGAQH